MKLVRLKITDPNGFRSLPCGFEHCFRTEWTMQEELISPDGFAPFVCAGPNGSGKSNLLEALAAIFFQLEVLRVRRSFLPEALQGEALNFSPVAFELDYLIRVPAEYRGPDSPEWANVGVLKNTGESVRLFWNNQSNFDAGVPEILAGNLADMLLPQYVLGYSSGENEILSLPFFKMRFVQFDEYWNALTKQLSYPATQKHGWSTSTAVSVRPFCSAICCSRTRQPYRPSARTWASVHLRSFASSCGAVLPLSRNNCKTSPARTKASASRRRRSSRVTSTERRNRRDGRHALPPESDPVAGGW